MYMMQAGKAEINRLNTVVDEPAKVVQELKAEISKRKSSGDFMVEPTVYQKGVDIKPDQSFLKKSSMENDDIDVGYASSILTEELQQNVLEMDKLEAELECELLKLHVSATDTSSSFQVLLSYLKYSIYACLHFLSTFTKQYSVQTQKRVHLAFSNQTSTLSLGGVWMCDLKVICHIG